METHGGFRPKNYPEAHWWNQGHSDLLLTALSGDDQQRELQAQPGPQTGDGSPAPLHHRIRTGSEHFHHDHWNRIPGPVRTRGAGLGGLGGLVEPQNQTQQLHQQSCDL